MEKIFKLVFLASISMTLFTISASLEKIAKNLQSESKELKECKSDNMKLQGLLLSDSLHKNCIRVWDK